MNTGKLGIVVLGLGVVSLLVPTRAFADGATDPTAVETTLTVTYLPPSSWTNPFAGTVQLFTGTTGNLIPLGSPETFSVPAVQTNTIVEMLGDVATAACWIALGGDTITTTPTGSTISIPIFAFPSGISLTGLSAPSAAPIVSTGMTDGSSVFTATGPIIAFDNPEAVGMWTLTETPVVAPEPASLSLLVIALGSTVILGWTRRKHLA